MSSNDYTFPGNLCKKIFLMKELNFFNVFSTIFFQFGKHQYGLIQRGRLMFAICYRCGTCTSTSVKHTQRRRAVFFVTPLLTSVHVFLPINPSLTYHSLRLIIHQYRLVFIFCY